MPKYSRSPAAAGADGSVVLAGSVTFAASGADSAGFAGVSCFGAGAGVAAGFDASAFGAADSAAGEVSFLPHDVMMPADKTMRMALERKAFCMRKRVWLARSKPGGNVILTHSLPCSSRFLTTAAKNRHRALSAHRCFMVVTYTTPFAMLVVALMGDLSSRLQSTFFSRPSARQAQLPLRVPA